MSDPKTVIDAITRISSAVEKLVCETERLRRDVAAVAALFEGRPVRDPNDPWWPEPSTPKKVTAESILTAVNDARRRLGGAEYDLSFIRSTLVSIASDAVSRDEMKPWLKK